MATTVVVAGAAGLTAAEVAERVRRGDVNDVPQRSSRSVADIVRANVFTRFNAILGTLLAVILVVGPIQDALFGFVLVANTGIGILQEWRAKVTLDRLAVLNAPRARVRRDGATHEIGVDGVVLDDVLELQSGDQVAVDGTVLDAAGLEVDESLLSGESEPVVKQPGDTVLSGSFVAAGSGAFRATKVGREAYARALAEEAQRFTLVHSELRAGIDRILRLVTWLIVPTAVLLVTSQLIGHESLPDAIRGSVAGVGSMIPEGLVLLTSIAFAVGVVRLGKRQVLVQEMPAIEGLARVDVVCIDKTGTLTEGEMAMRELVALDPAVPAADVLGALGAADPHPNASLRVLIATYPAPTGWAATGTVPFSSARKWSAADLGTNGAWVLGGPDVLLVGVGAGADDVRRQAEAGAEAGHRVLLLARAPGGLTEEHLPPDLEPAALVVLEERIRPDAAATLAYFRDQGVDLKVISGDHPSTVGSVAGRLGLHGADDPVDARTLPEDPAGLAEALETHSVFGRVTPQQKRAMVGALQGRGHVVAMTGDGVNDVLALKDADIGVAMGNGSPAARSVAQLVLLDSTFDVLPHVVAEGRRVLANIERVANLFLTKTVYAMLLALAVGVATLPFPFYPRHLTIVSSLTIGIPAFFLALAPNPRRARPGFVARVLRFAIPAGTVAAAATFGAYAMARAEPGVELGEARTTATIVLCLVGLWVLAILARPLTVARRWLVVAMAGGFVLLLVLPPLRDAFALDLPRMVVWLAGIGLVALAGAGLEGGWRLARWVHLRYGNPDDEWTG